MKYRIMLIGSDKVWSLERIYCKHLVTLGHEVELFAAQNIFYDYYGKNIFNKIVFRAGLSGIFRSINDELVKRVEKFQPNLVWVFKGMEVLPDTLERVKAMGIKTVNYNPDNPFFFSGSGSGNQNVTRSIKLYDLHFTYDRDILHNIESRYKIPCCMLPFGFELAEELYEKSCQQEELIKVCFLGNPDKWRVEFLEQIAEEVAVDVYGNNWHIFTKHRNISVFGPVYGEDFWKTLYRYRVQLNLLRPHNPASHNMRSFEIPGVGGIGLFPRTVDHEEYFESMGIANLYTGPGDCVNKAKQLLNLSPHQAALLRKNARKLSLESGYDYYSRTKQFLENIKKIM